MKLFIPIKKISDHIKGTRMCEFNQIHRIRHHRKVPVVHFNQFCFPKKYCKCIYMFMYLFSTFISGPVPDGLGWLPKTH